MDGIWSLLAQSQPSPTFQFIDKLARAPLSSVLIFAAVCTVIRASLYFYLRNVAKHERVGFYGFAKFLNEFADALVYAGIVVFMLVRPFGIQTFYIPSGSMVDTLRRNDMIVANKLIYRYTEPQRGDIVVFKPPKRALAEGQQETDFIKRLVGVPGDVIEIRNKVLYRNGQAQNEKYVCYTTGPGNEQVLPKSDWPDAFIPDFKLVEYKGEFMPVVTDNRFGNDLINPLGPVAKEYVVDPSDTAKIEELKALPPTKVPEGYFLMMGDNRNGSFDSRGWGLVAREDIIGRSEVIWFPFSRWRATD